MIAGKANIPEDHNYVSSKRLRCYEALCAKQVICYCARKAKDAISARPWSYTHQCILPLKSCSILLSRRLTSQQAVEASERRFGPH